MNPTHELRFVERKVVMPISDNNQFEWTISTQVLQQKWAGAIQANGVISATYEWRDVPCVKDHR